MRSGLFTIRLNSSISSLSLSVIFTFVFAVYAGIYETHVCEDEDKYEGDYVIVFVFIFVFVFDFVIVA